jgi:uncharacterized membrane protein YeaQ/YmgE (transglycosylase-associated protein family)
MNNASHPDPETRWLSHLIVGCAVGAVAGKHSGTAGFITTAIIGALVHEALDAPIATLLTDIGT